MFTKEIKKWSVTLFNRKQRFLLYHNPSPLLINQCLEIGKASDNMTRINIAFWEERGNFFSLKSDKLCQNFFPRL